MGQSEIKSYTNDDVNKVLQQIYVNAVEDRTRAIDIYTIMKDKIDRKEADELFVLNSITNTLNSIQKSNDDLLKLATVMQRLQTNVITQLKKGGSISSDEYNSLLTNMDELEKANKLKE